MERRTAGSARLHEKGTIKRAQGLAPSVEFLEGSFESFLDEAIAILQVLAADGLSSAQGLLKLDGNSLRLVTKKTTFTTHFLKTATTS